MPISLYEIPSQLHHILRYYKSGALPGLQAGYTTNVAALLGHFLTTHGGCIRAAAGADWDVIVPVPSSRDRVGQHPLVTAIGMVPSLRSQLQLLLTRGPGDTGHRIARDDSFAVQIPLSGQRVLLVDDTFTSGARVQSAASAINVAGGQVVAIVPVGRVIDPAFGDHVAQYWKRQSAIPFSFDTCCLE